MTDTVTSKRRSEIMANIRSKGMRPEMLVRRLVHSMGYRYRIHRSDLPGKPDLAFPPPAQGDLRSWLLLASARQPRPQDR